MKQVTLSRLSDLPEWDVVLNFDPDSPLCVANAAPGGAADMLAVCHMGAGFSHPINWEALRTARPKPIDVHILMRSSDAVRMAGLAARLREFPALVLRSSLLCSADVLQSVHEAYAARIAKLDSKTESNEHALFDEIGMLALERGSSDIHLTLFEDRATVCLRIKGELIMIRDLPLERAKALAASAYNTLAEKGSTKDGFNERAYQDAVIERIYPQGLVRFRYSSVPLAPSGCDITLRLIPIGVTSKPKTLAQLGYSVDQCEQLERIFSRSSGLVLIAGTTGSGKSTTLATVLVDMARRNPGKKIRTIEEPVEYKIAGAYQTPVVRREDTGVNPFGVALRQLMRSDPDVIMVGEIRDKDTAQLAISGVRSGHMLVSTIHADGAPICYDRLIGMGIERTDLAAVGLIAGLIYQKLVPVLCPHCCLSYADWRISERYDAALEGRIRKVVSEGGMGALRFRNTQGCEQCDHDGVSGREVAAEILRPTPEFGKHILNADSAAIWRAWRKQIIADEEFNMTGRTAFEHAIYKMRQGRVDPRAVEDAFHYLDEPVFVQDDGGVCA